MKKGLRVCIYKHKGQSHDAGRGISSRTDSATLVASSDFPGIPEIFGVDESAPAVAIVKRSIAGREYLTAYPLDSLNFIDRNCMFGGCYIKTSDSRFPAVYPVPLHDRKES